MILLARLKRAGAEKRLRQNQFGFRSGRSTADALFIVRRNMEAAWSRKGGSLMLLALDWRKTFDRILPDALFAALRRFGLPEEIIEVIKNIYASRSFTVTDCGRTSATRRQSTGISQGCPLSPFLFGIVMTILMHDAVALLGKDAKEAYEIGTLSDIEFADDTMLMGVNHIFLQEVTDAVEKVGREFGLELHWGKVQLANVQSDQRILSTVL